MPPERYGRGRLRILLRSADPRQPLPRTTILPDGHQCIERHVPHIRKRGREGWDLPDHWRTMMRWHPGAQEPDRCRTYRDLVHAGHIAWLSDTGCPGGYQIPMVAFDEAPWDRFLDRPLRTIVCPTCRKAMSMRYTCGGLGPGGKRIVPLDANEAA